MKTCRPIAKVTSESAASIPPHNKALLAPTFTLPTRLEIPLTTTRPRASQIAKIAELAGRDGDGPIRKNDVVPAPYPPSTVSVHHGKIKLTNIKIAETMPRMFTPLAFTVSSAAACGGSSRSPGPSASEVKRSSSGEALGAVTMSAAARVIPNHRLGHKLILFTAQSRAGNGEGRAPDPPTMNIVRRWGSNQ